MPKIVNLASFRKPEAFYQTVLSDRSIQNRQKFVENAKIQEFRGDVLTNFQTI